MAISGGPPGQASIISTTRVGHGGNLIVLLDELDMIVVTTADPLYELLAGAGWKYEGSIIDLVGKFIKSLPSE